ncbi:xanthine permease [Erysipelothrix sp. HDW6A]|uniref:uracil-xanthine permease family protein n=1 Tax=Erysipelothrix sp. HDW6A TaxID=2714928 RepID=UPI00140A2B20|nr:solute carrier family 23 protein [Erysipelothrix sp. HDW6A]QIK56960.1 xanthine permease [Erysipelothrix sp. HDW6A]
MEKKNTVMGYLPDEKPTLGKMILFAIQQILVMFPATVMVALLTGFHVSTTIFASGFATLCFLFITKGKIPLYYGSSFSYITAIVGITGGAAGAISAGATAPDALISQAQFGIIASGFVSIAAGLVVNKFGQEKIEKFLPATVTGSIAIIIGLSLAGSAMTGAIGYDAATNTMDTNSLIVAFVTLTATVLFSVYVKKGVLGQLPILMGIGVGYALSLALNMVDFSQVMANGVIATPHFTLPKPNLEAVWAIMPIAIATIPESTAHLFQLDIYVNNLAKEKGVTKKYDIADKLGSNLIGDGVGDIVSSMFGGPAGTNYGENISTMAITNNFSVYVLGAAAVLTMIISFISPLAALVTSVPSAVINGAGVYLFGVIGAQGIAILINKEVDLFDAKNLAIIAIILVVGLGGNFAFPGGMIPVGTMQLPAIATASILGIFFNIMLNIKKTK